MSEESDKKMTENDDERIIIDDLGVLRLKPQELELLRDKHLAAETYSDRDPQMCRKFENLLKKKVTFKDVTEEILKSREILKKPDETIWKEKNLNTLKTEKQLSRLLLCKSKTSKRSIPDLKCQNLCKKEKPSYVRLG